MNTISVVMPVYGQWDLVKRNIDSLHKYDDLLISEIIVVDDCSPSPNPFVFTDKRIIMMKNERNLGYAGTVNSGLKNVSNDIVLLLDSDAYLIQPIVAEILKMYEENPALGCVGYRTVDDKGKITGSFSYEPILLSFILGQKIGSKLNELPFAKNRNIIPYSCSVSFRRKCLEEMNYFSHDDFPVLDADIDLSMRIHRSRWKLEFSENIILSHSGGNSYKINYKRVLLYYKSRWQLFKKHNLIKFPALTKSLILTRLRIELQLLNFLTYFNKGNEKLLEKRDGRIIIIKEVSKFAL